MIQVLDTNKRSLFLNTLLPKITPDILICNNTVQEKFVLVGDTKYKRQSKPSDEDWYQIITYTAALNVSAGILIYPTEQPKPPEEYHIDGRSIWVYYFLLQSPKTQEKDLFDFLRKQIANPGN